jgi:hypothetical protein
MAEAQYLRANTGIADPALFSTDPSTSLYAPIPWSVSTNTVRVQADIPPQNASQFSNTSFFEISKDATYASWAVLRYTVSAVTFVGPTTYARFQDFAGVFNVQEIRIMYDSNLLKTIRPEEYLYYYHKWLGLEKQRGFEISVGGQLTDLERSTRALAPQTFNLPILWGWWYNLKNSFPIVALSQKLRIEVDWRNAQNVIQTDDFTGVTLPTITSSFLRLQYVNVTGAERAYILQHAASADGINYLQDDFVYQRRMVIPAGTATVTPFTNTISNIRSPVAVINMLLRPVVYVDTQTGNPDESLIVQEDWNSSSAGGTGTPLLVSGAAKPTGGILNTWQVTSSNNRITPVLERDWDANDVHCRYFPSTPAPDLLSWPYSNSPTTYAASYDSINYAQINEPIINVLLATALVGSDYFLDAIAQTKNFIQVQGGSTVRTFIS